jgi:hypothetical protein
VLAPRLTAATDSPVLGWEKFVREIEQRDTGRRTLFGGVGGRAYIQRATSADWYTALLFGLTPPALAVAYVATLQHLHRGLGTRIWLEVSLVGLLWLIALWRFVAFKRTVKNIATAILARGGQGTAGHGPPAA